MRRALILLLLLCASAIAADSAGAASFGRWHVPSTPAQFFGYGYGPGHHAPMVRYHGHRPYAPQRIVHSPAHCYPYCQPRW